MKLGLCIEMALTKLPFEERIAKAAELGLGNVEFWFVDMTFQGKAERLAELARKHKVTITNTVIGSPDGSIGGGLTDPAHREEWFKRAKMTIDFTREAQIPATIVCTGNEVPGMSDDAMYASVVEGLKPTVELAEEAGVTLMLEPLNIHCDHPGYWLTSSDRGAEICRRLDSPRMRLLFDCYHMQIMEGNLLQHIERNLDVIGHFHMAGVPGRHELFEGEVNYPYLVKKVTDMGYHGVFGLEYAPSKDDEVSIKETMKHLGF
ncbi:MAG: TIM barrel protein [Candidatus Hydrogenedentes bacterium]|nr:TIM barrel protein [Candidatus Hydrogenedentota bacterium]